jgi:predicted dithiol-disulfide oxidoreductase (DUF899 family)
MSDDSRATVGPLSDVLREAADHADEAERAVEAGDMVAARRSLLRLERLLDRADDRTATARVELADAAVDAWLSEAGNAGDPGSTSG